MFKDMPLARKLTAIILVVSLSAMLLVRATFFTLDYRELRQRTVEQLKTLGDITVKNCAAALAFGDPNEARDTLAALSSDKNVVAACLYDRAGGIFTEYPASAPADYFPAAPGADGFSRDGFYVSGFQAVEQPGSGRLGTLYIRFDTSPIIYAWLWHSLVVTPAIFLLALVAAYLLSRELQRKITGPILDIAGAARAISDRQDYSVRVGTLGRDELGQLAEAFNQMVERIQKQNKAIMESENQLKTIVENLSEGLAVSDLNGRLLHFNQTALVMYGFESLADCQVHLSRIREIFELSTLDGRVIAAEEWPLARILAGEHIHNLELRIHNREKGWSKIFGYGGALVKDDKGKPIMAIATINDITQRKMAEMEVKKLNMELERRVAQRTAQLEIANQDLEAFSYSVSHDLRAPLRHIDGFAGLLAKRNAAALNDEGRRYLGTISAAAKRMGCLIDDLLAFSRSRRAEMSRSTVDQDELVASVVRDGAYDQRTPAIEWKIAGLPPVTADAAMLRQVWHNLIENASKYSGKREFPCIGIGHLWDEARQECVFFVKDNGVGFDMAYADKLFGVFQRLHSQEEFEGTGIGLANVRQIVARHGGRTWAEGRVGVGATVYFSLPGESVSAAWRTPDKQAQAV